MAWLDLMRVPGSILISQKLANRYSLAGREISYRRLPPNSYFGELAVFDGQPRSVNIVALSEVEIGRLSGPAFSELMVAIPGMTKALLRDMSARIRDLSDRIYETTASSVKMRWPKVVRMAAKRAQRTARSSLKIRPPMPSGPRPLAANARPSPAH